MLTAIYNRAAEIQKRIWKEWSACFWNQSGNTGSRLVNMVNFQGRRCIVVDRVTTSLGPLPYKSALALTQVRMQCVAGQALLPPDHSTKSFRHTMAAEDILPY